jgi:hypothetical protein
VKFLLLLGLSTDEHPRTIHIRTDLLVINFAIFDALANHIVLFSERFNQNLQDMLHKCIAEGDDDPSAWEDHLQAVVFAYNTSKHSSTQFSPFFLMYNR